MINKVFYIQNPIALIVAEKLIDTFSFTKEECLFIYGRNMKPSGSEFKSVLWDEYVQQYSWNFLEGNKAVKKTKKAIDNLIATHIRESFTFYTSSFSLWFLKYLASHSKCESFNFLEEGASSFFSRQERAKIQDSTFFSLKIFYYLKILLSHRFTYFPNPYTERSFLNKCKAIYTFSDGGFADYNQRVQIDPPFHKKESLQNIKAVFAPWYIVESGAMAKEIYFNSMREVFERISSLGENTIHYKFHPQHLVKGKYIHDYKNLFIEFSGKIDFIELDHTISLENVAYSSKANFYVDVSSVALYAKTCGSKIFSYCDILIKNDPSFSQFTLPKELKNIVFPGNLLK